MRKHNQGRYQQSRHRRELLQRVKEGVLSIVPDAEVVLYGSRARGEARADSDWDILVLTDAPGHLRTRTAYLDQAVCD